jgi:hypothetical protein
MKTIGVAVDASFDRKHHIIRMVDTVVVDTANKRIELQG